MVDRYTKVVLTVIAAALVWLCLWGPGPARLGRPAEASLYGQAVDVNIAEVGGLRVGHADGLPVTLRGVEVLGGLPVTLRRVEVLGGVPVCGTPLGPPVKVRVTP